MPSKKTEALITLSIPKKKQLCQDLETNGGLRHCNFKSICALKEEFYGGKGHNLRRAFQKQVDIYKRRSLSTYILELETIGVTPSDTTYNDSRIPAADDFVDLDLDADRDSDSESELDLDALEELNDFLAKEEEGRCTKFAIMSSSSPF